VKKLKLGITLYNAMLNCFENSVIESFLHQNLKILMEKSDKYFSGQIGKIENENIFKQYFLFFIFIFIFFLIKIFLDLRKI